MASNRTSNGYQELAEVSVEEATSGPNENSKHIGKEYDIEQSEITARRPGHAKQVQSKEDDSLSAAFCAWLFNHQIGTAPH